MALVTVKKLGSEWCKPQMTLVTAKKLECEWCKPGFTKSQHNNNPESNYQHKIVLNGWHK